jgi:hypothetical protein
MLDQGIIPGVFAAFEDDFDDMDHEALCDPVRDKGKKQKEDDG